MQSDNGIQVLITKDPLDVRQACAAVADPANGGIDMFVGVVRNNHLGQSVTGITYDVHETLAAAELMNICREAQGIWPQTKYFAAHYQGYLDVGGISVLIAASAPHREEAFESCRYIIEEIKKRLPVWKKEHYTDGESAWLPGHSLVSAEDDDDIDDDHAACCGRRGTHG